MQRQNVEARCHLTCIDRSSSEYTYFIVKSKRKSHPVKPNHSIPITRKSSKFSFKLPFLFYFHQIHQPIAILILYIYILHSLHQTYLNIRKISTFLLENVSTFIQSPTQTASSFSSLLDDNDNPHFHHHHQITFNASMHTMYIMACV